MGRQGREVYRTRDWRAARLRALDRDRWRCVKCGKAGRLEVHHKRRIADGGEPFDLANLETLCRGCHFDRHPPDRRRKSAGREAWRQYATR